MRRLLLLLTLAAAPVAPFLQAQSSQPQPAAPAACPSTATLDQLINAIDDAVSGPADKDRTCFRQLFLPDARLIPIRIAAGGTATPVVLTVDGWIEAVRKRGTQLWSTYETRTTPDGKPPEGKVLDRGINSIQAVYDGKQWHVQEILWQAETPADPVPAKYLP